MSEPIRFLQLSDMHLIFQAPESDRLGTLLARTFRPLEVVRRLLRAERSWRPDFLLFTGDLADRGGDTEYAAMRRVLTEEMPGVPWVALPGNHDDRAAFRRSFLRVPPQEPLDRVCNFGGLRVVTLDTGVDGVISSGQVEWLVQQLAAEAPRGTVLAIHHPLYAQSPMPPARYPPEFARLIAGSRLVGIFCGHTHENYFGSFEGVPYVTADACSFAVEEEDGRLFARLCAGYLRAQIGGSGLSVQMKRAAPDGVPNARFPI